MLTSLYLVLAGIAGRKDHTGSETDRGILVVCDSRLSSMSYGRRLVKGLPPMRRLEDHESFLEALHQLTTDATHARS